MARGDAVDDPGIPVVEVGGQVIDEDHRYAGAHAQLAVNKSSSAYGNRLCGGLFVRRATNAGARYAQMTYGIVASGSFA
ncbi:hypothetical protein MXEN_12311 [Mycobacterium xenopi RIVM700367]|nr:hypothetical protein MXEN_12311 [Mycobacterium xenopi RIVM700367]